MSSTLTMLLMNLRKEVCMRKLMMLLFLFPLTVLGEVKEVHLPYPLDLAREAKVAGADRKPFLFLFSVDGCSYCEVIRQHHLQPLSRSAASPVIREIKIGDRQNFIDFDGKKTDHAEFARRYNARWAPTVILVDYRGKKLTDSLSGGDTSGLYGGMLEKALYEANVEISRSR